MGVINAGEMARRRSLVGRALGALSNRRPRRDEVRLRVGRARSLRLGHRGVCDTMS